MSALTMHQITSREPMTFGAIVKAARIARGLGVGDLAEQMQRSHTLISQWERDKQTPKDRETIAKLATFLEVDADALYQAAGVVPPDIERALRDATRRQLDYVRSALQIERAP